MMWYKHVVHLVMTSLSVRLWLVGLWWWLCVWFFHNSALGSNDVHVVCWPYYQCFVCCAEALGDLINANAQYAPLSDSPPP